VDVISFEANDITVVATVFPTKWHTISGQNPVDTLKREFTVVVLATMVNNFCLVETELKLLEVEAPASLL